SSSPPVIGGWPSRPLNDLDLECGAATVDRVPVSPLDGFSAGYSEELVHPASGDAEHQASGGERDANVEPEADVLHVMEVVGDLAADAGQIGVRRQLHLSQAGNTGADPKAFLVMRDRAIELGHELRSLWAGADQAHLAAEHVPELGQLVQVAGAKEAA